MIAMRRILIYTGFVAIVVGFFSSEASTDILGSWQHKTLLWRIEFLQDGRVRMMTIGQPILGRYWLDASVLTVQMQDGQIFQSKISVTSNALVIADRDGTSNTFDRGPMSPSDNPYIDTYNAGEGDVNNMLDASLGSIDETYRGTHQYFRDDVIGLIISALAAQVSHPFVSSIKQALESRSAAELRTYCDAYIKTFPDDPIEISFGGVVSISTTLGKVCGSVLAQQPGGQ